MTGRLRRFVLATWPVPVAAVLRWNGSQWYSTAAEDVGGLGRRTNELHGVATVSATDAWAVGRYVQDDGRDAALIERFSPRGPADPALSGRYASGRAP
jgi:hypothetical protein